MNGYIWYVDINKEIIAEDQNFTNYTTFNHLCKWEKEYIRDYIKYNDRERIL
jgi:ribonucleotide reductase beta subunit family protein with ferritin-like domain